MVWDPESLRGSNLWGFRLLCSHFVTKKVMKRGFEGLGSEIDEQTGGYPQTPFVSRAAQRLCVVGWHGFTRGWRTLRDALWHSEIFSYRFASLPWALPIKITENAKRSANRAGPQGAGTVTAALLHTTP